MLLSVSTIKIFVLGDTPGFLVMKKVDRLRLTMTKEAIHSFQSDWIILPAFPIGRSLSSFMYFLLSVSDLISALKSSHFQNSSILFIRFLVCSTSDEVTVDAFGNHLG
jgi:hypothetical protein